ncbi:hypothetical protein [Planktothrix tepida]|uniref:hypothetical protein n=1 Tax=Planktothrix tepida TaxID=1678309 RepID=UPI0020B29F9E|nr:hypothetical protein [Planktothrix tepida]
MVETYRAISHCQLRHRVKHPTPDVSCIVSNGAINNLDLTINNDNTAPVTTFIIANSAVLDGQFTGVGDGSSVISLVSI